MEYPYRSQWDTDGDGQRNDCGPACVCMVLERFGRWVEINDITQATMGAPYEGTSADDLAAELRKRGVTALVWTGLELPKLPAICLVSYAGFERASVQDVEYRGWHWLIVLSVNDLTVVCHDPDYWGDRRNEGSHKRYSRAEFDQAFLPYGQTKVAVVWDETPLPRVGVVESDMAFLRVRATPGGPEVGYLKNGAGVTVVDERGPWYQVKCTAFYPNVFMDAALTQPYAAPELSGWVYAPLVRMEEFRG